MKMTIGKRITFGFAVAVLITVGLGVFTYSRVHVIAGKQEEISGDTIPGLLSSSDVVSMQRDNAYNLASLLMSTDKSQADKIREDMKTASEQIDAAMVDYEKTINEEADRKNFETAKTARNSFSAVQKHCIELFDEGKQKEAGAFFLSDVAPALDKVDDAFVVLTKYQKENATEDFKTMDGAVHSTITGVIVGVGAATLAAIVIATLTSSTIKKALTRMAESLGSGSAQVAAASSQVSGSSQSLAQGATEQAAALEESSSSLEEMSSMTQRNADTAQHANDSMKRMSGAITEIEKSAGETAKIIKTIDEIAFQTNLLALNAAVEAARAGEAGKGFAVVAEEVRNLAMRSAEAAKNTSSLIEQSVTSARNGVKIAGEVATVLEEITAASKEQATGIGQVNVAVQQMDKVTQSNAAAAEESAAASEELNSQAEQLRSTVDELLSLVGASAAQHSHIRPLHKAHASKIEKTQPAVSSKASESKRAAQLIPLETEKSEKDFSAFNAAT